MNLMRTAVGGAGAAASGYGAAYAVQRFGLPVYAAPLVQVALGYVAGRSDNRMLRDAGSGAAVSGFASAMLTAFQMMKGANNG